MQTITTEVFAAEALAASPLHAAVSARIQQQNWRDWPSDAQLNQLLPTGATTGAGRALHFVSNADAGIDGAAAYERHINETGEIPLRPNHWHDLFNALMWISFPITKTAFNQAHRRELANDAGQRSARRDALTLLDECGVLLAVADESLTTLHTQHRWHELFVARREEWGKLIVPLIIGHGLYEQCLQPYIGLTAKALHVAMPERWFAESPAEQYRQIDTALGARIERDDALLTTKELLPLPVLGVPDWWPANRDPAFYANENYFRPKR